MAPVFFLLAGPNGAGKSTLYHAAVAEGLIPAEIEFVNADLYEARHLQHITSPAQRSEAARAWADTRRAALLAAGRSFVSETVFSHVSKLALIEAAQRAGFVVVLLVVCVDDPQQLLRRVLQRVSEGGHSVPGDRVLARYPRTLTHLRDAVRRVDLALLYDTSDSSEHDGIQPPRLVARWRKGQAAWMASKPPAWTMRLLA